MMTKIQILDVKIRTRGSGITVISTIPDKQTRDLFPLIIKHVMLPNTTDDIAQLRQATVSEKQEHKLPYLYRRYRVPTLFLHLL
jgi:hypothetical protein